MIPGTADTRHLQLLPSAGGQQEQEREQVQGHGEYLQVSTGLWTLLTSDTLGRKLIRRLLLMAAYLIGSRQDDCYMVPGQFIIAHAEILSCPCSFRF